MELLFRRNEARVRSFYGLVAWGNWSFEIIGFVYRGTNRKGLEGRLSPEFAGSVAHGCVGPIWH
ncbi:hypothetical protein D3C87_223050 [compost metagenome]